MIDEIINTYLKPFMGSLPDFFIATAGFLGAIASFVPKDSKLGRALNKVTESILELKKFITKKK